MTTVGVKRLMLVYSIIWLPYMAKPGFVWRGESKSTRPPTAPMSVLQPRPIGYNHDKRIHKIIVLSV